MFEATIFEALTFLVLEGGPKLLMVDKSKSTAHSKIISPSSTSSISSTSQITKEEIDKSIQTPTTKVSIQSANQPPESPEFEALVHKFQGFSLSLEESEISEGSVTSQFVSSRSEEHRLNSSHLTASRMPSSA